MFQAFVATAMLCTLMVSAVTAQRERFSRRIEQERERFASVLRAATEYSVIGTDLFGTITVFNEGAERMLGYRAVEVIGEVTPAVIHSSDEVVARAAELEIEPGFDVFVKNAREGAAETRQWTYVRKDGTTLQVSLTVTAIVGGDGEPVGFIGIAQDITERLGAQQRLARSEAQHRAVVEHMPDAVVSLFDTDLRCLMIEGGALARIGRTTSEFVGGTLQRLMPAQDAALLEPVYRAALARPRAVHRVSVFSERADL